jgi:hypothetical protein
VVSSGWDEKKATDTVARFQRFLEERRDEFAALQILYRLPYAQRRHPNLPVGAVSCRHGDCSAHGRQRCWTS